MNPVCTELHIWKLRILMKSTEYKCVYSCIILTFLFLLMAAKRSLVLRGETQISALLNSVHENIQRYKGLR
jgi:hypothetical protein